MTTDGKNVITEKKFTNTKSPEKSPNVETDKRGENALTKNASIVVSDVTSMATTDFR